MIAASICISLVMILALVYLLLAMNVLPWWCKAFLLALIDVIDFVLKWGVCLALLVAFIAIWFLPEGVL